MRQKQYEQIPLEHLEPGVWYVGRGRNNDVALWTGTYFLTIGSEMGRASMKRELYWQVTPDVSFASNVEENLGTFQPFLALDTGDELNTLESEGRYTSVLGFPSRTGPHPNAEWTLEGQTRLQRSARRVLGLERDRPVETPVHKIVSTDHEE
jgi:hypothetical protein